MFSPSVLPVTVGAIEFQQARPTAGDRAEDRVNAAGIVDVLDVILAAGGHLADVRRAAA